MTFQKGDVVLAQFPYAELTGKKRRPCLVLAKCDDHDDYILAFITSINKDQKFPSAVWVNDEHKESTGLKTDSWVRVDKLATINTQAIRGKIGNLPLDLLEEARQKVLHLLT
jgi:mRNA interferase MazF